MGSLKKFVNAFVARKSSKYKLDPAKYMPIGNLGEIN